jgi:hypothetical protein
LPLVRLLFPALPAELFPALPAELFLPAVTDTSPAVSGAQTPARVAMGSVRAGCAAVLARSSPMGIDEASCLEEASRLEGVG